MYTGPSEGEVRILALVALEQFVEGLPGETMQQIRCHQPANLKADVTLTEDHMAAQTGVWRDTASRSANCSQQTAANARTEEEAPRQSGRHSHGPRTPFLASLFSCGLDRAGTVLEPWRPAQMLWQECWTGSPETGVSIDEGGAGVLRHQISGTVP